MNVLGPGYQPGQIPSVACEPQLLELEVRGRKFVFDANTVALAELQGDETSEDLASFAAAYKPNFPFFMPSRPGAILFNVTKRCNLACDYCFSAQDACRAEKQKDLDLETALAGVGLLVPRKYDPQRSPGKALSISFFGGEPLLRFSLMRQIVSSLEKLLPIPCSFHVTTNGTLITPEVAGFLQEHNFSAIVSLDGSKTGHDHLRKYPTGKGSFDDVIQGLENLRQHGPSVSARTTLRGTFTADSLKVESLVDRLGFLNSLCDDGLGSHVSVEPVFLGESACTDPQLANEMTPDPNRPETHTFWEETYAATATWWLERLRARKSPRFHHYNAYMRRLRMGAANVSECGASKGYFSISPGGVIYACHRESNTKVGHIKHGGVDHELAAPWIDNRYYSRLKCPSCPFRNLCGGGCREMSAAAGLGVSMPFPAECAMKMLFFKNIAWILSEVASGGPGLDHLDNFLGIRRQDCAGCGEQCSTEPAGAKVTMRVRSQEAVDQVRGVRGDQGAVASSP